MDIYNPLTNQWYPTLNMGIARHHPSAVLLPTGEVAILAGHDDLPPGQEQTRRAQVLDPSQKSAGALGVIRTGNSQANEVRGYHNVAVLLPDGRVLVGGGNPGGMWAQEKATIEFWSPPYMNGLRPKIVSAPGTVKLGAQFDISYSSTDPITVVVLMGLGSITHSFDMNQRYVQLKIVAGGDPGQGSVTVEGPPDARHAQPGPYMLFILGGGRIPSEAKMVQVVD